MSSATAEHGLFHIFMQPIRFLYRFTISFIRWIFVDRNIKQVTIRLFGIFVTLCTLYFVYLWITLPNIEDPGSLLASQSTVISDRNGIELYRLHGEEDRTAIAGSLIPDSMRNAIIAIEDERFYERGCLDIRAIGRAVFLLGQAGGGSTITRQLARNALNLHKDNRYKRKIKEVILGCQLEHKYSKDELIELYLNWIPFGQNAYGIEQASQRYFGHTSSGLTLAESAILASLPQRPTYFSPYGKHVRTNVTEDIYNNIVDGKITRLDEIDDEDLRIGLLGAYVGTGSTVVYIGGRTDQVLKNMEDLGSIEESERLAALAELDIIEFKPSRENIRAPHFVLWVRDQVEEMFAGTSEEGLLERGGLNISTTLDWNLQQIAENAVSFHQEDIINRFGANNVGLVSIDRETNEILAYIGNMDYGDTENGGKIDMVHVPRQPGSSFKPFIYTAAFQKGYSPATPLYDVPTKIGDDEPQNFDGQFNGLMNIRSALGASRNVPAAKAFFLGGGEDSILALVSNMGAPFPMERRAELKSTRPDGFDYGWPLALGAAETPLIEMVNAYDTLASEGMYKTLISIFSITDRHGNLLYEAESEERDVLDPRIAYQMTSILSDVQARPDEYWQSQLTVPGFQTAAKTGTSNKCLERNEEDGSCLLLKPDNAWLLGYTPALVTGVWVGNADSSSLFDTAGGLNTASPIWHDYMIRAHRDLAPSQKEFPIPEGIVRPQISLLSGEFPTECTPVNLRKSDVFLQENAPSQADPMCKQLMVDRVTNLLASDACPAEARESGSFLMAKSLLPDRWPTWEEGVQEWMTTQMELWNATPDHSGSLLPLPVAPLTECDPALTPGRLTKPELTIIFPVKNGSVGYPSFKPRIKYEVGSFVREITYEIDGKKVRTATSKPFGMPLRAPKSSILGGAHILKVTLTDEYFNTVSSSISFRFEEDKTSPVVRLIVPSEGAKYSSLDSITMKAKSSDLNGAVKYVQFYIDDILLSTKPTQPFELTYPVKGLSKGLHVLKVLAEDMAGNEGDDSIEFYVE
ncbi:MAG: penicillin-binding protein [Candidatus Peribacteraceae bacterium]|nr:penicillin-binding protein [Candidatus Peribacteraceae bacterium]